MKVARLRAHNEKIRATARKKRAKVKFLELFDDINKMLRPGHDLGINSKKGTED
jgi:hypothetical protein